METQSETIHTIHRSPEPSLLQNTSFTFFRSQLIPTLFFLAEGETITGSTGLFCKTVNPQNLKNFCKPFGGIYFSETGLNSCVVPFH